MITSSEIAYLTHQAETRGPDADCITRDDSGRTWSRFAVDWTCDGRNYSTHIWATDAADAERRLHALRSNAVVVGQVMAERDVA
ncbi:hypothetical protein ACWX0K_15095 [Nitrobacteraceae bacterium UC4446_H13]